MLNPVSFTHLDVYKRQAPHMAQQAVSGKHDSLVFHQESQKLKFLKGQRHLLSVRNHLMLLHQNLQVIDLQRRIIPVSYTHLDVYKRQVRNTPIPRASFSIF